MPKANKSKRTRHILNRATTLYDDDESCEGEGGHHITISWTASGRIILSSALPLQLQTQTNHTRDSADPWTAGFFDSNTKAFVVEVDSPPDELLDFDPLESQPELKGQRMVRMPFTLGFSHINSS
jgi:hypothetical protein